MAKMALNGYEIGIQRKIKPADHIQSMADRIQDTIVTKHPLNADGTSSGESSHDNTLKRSPNKISDLSYKTNSTTTSIGDKVKDVIYNTELIQSTFNDGSAPVPPPLPNSPMPIFSVHSTPTGHTMAQCSIKKQSEGLPKNLTSHITSTAEFENPDKSLNGSGYSSSEDSTIETNTLRKKKFLNGFNITQDIKKAELVFDNNFYSNTLNKKKIFEKQEPINTSSNSDNGLKGGNFVTNTLDTNTKNKINIFALSSNSDDKIKNQHHCAENLKNISIPSNFCDLSYNSSKCDNESNINAVKQDDEEILYSEDTNNINENTEPEVVVKRRQKRTNRNDDGRRDSHIIARPLSTMTSVDVADGLYPVCHKCDKEITRGPFITALGRIWCPEHFICVNATCRRPLQDIGFVEENGQLYCEYCFEQYIAPSCDKCHAKIKGDCLNAIGKHFHPECFNCVYCGKLFGNNPFFLEDGLPYCEADWNELFTTKCFACGFPVEAGDRWVEALNNNYHSQCFNCTVCKKNLEGQSFFAKGGRPFCKTHAR